MMSQFNPTLRCKIDENLVTHRTPHYFAWFAQRTQVKVSLKVYVHKISVLERQA